MKHSKYSDDYEEFRLNANAIPDKLNESNDASYLNDALDTVIELVELHEELGFNEMLPSWHKALSNAIAYMENHLPNVKDKAKHEQVKSAIKHGKLLQDEMPLLALHRFKAH